MRSCSKIAKVWPTCPSHIGADQLCWLLGKEGSWQGKQSTVGNSLSSSSQKMNSRADNEAAAMSERALLLQQRDTEGSVGICPSLRLTSGWNISAVCPSKQAIQGNIDYAAVPDTQDPTVGTLTWGGSSLVGHLWWDGTESITRREQLPVQQTLPQSCPEPPHAIQHCAAGRDTSHSALLTAKHAH